MEEKPRMEILFLAGIAMSLCAFGAWKWNNAESNSIERFAQSAKALEVKYTAAEAEISRLSTQATETYNRLVKAEEAAKQASERCNGMQAEIDESQVHLAKMRKSQQDLRDRSFPRHIEMTLKSGGTIPFEIIDGTNKPKGIKPNVSAKIKKQLEGLSQ